MNTHQKIPTLIVASITLSALPACSGSNFFTDAFRDKQAAFASLRSGVNGSSRDDTLYALGSPTSSHAVNIANFEGETLVFVDQKNRYSLLLINRSIYAKASTPRSSFFN